MADTKLLVLVERLLSLTNEAKLSWEETAEENIFQASVGLYVVQIIRQPDSYGGQWAYSIRISDRLGRLLDEATAGLRLGGILVEGQSSEISHDQLMQLWNAARRKALKADEALSEILSSLSSM